MVIWDYRIQDPKGLHARPASILVMAVLKFKSYIQITCCQHNADAKDIMEVMALGVQKDDLVTIQIQGEDEKEALEAVKKALAYDGFNPENGSK